MSASPSRAAHLPAAKALLAAHPLIDGHNDLPWVIRQAGYIDRLDAYDLTRLHAETDTDLPRLTEGMVATQVLAAFLPTFIESPEIVTQEQIDLILRIEDRHADRLFPVRHPDDVAAARKAGKIGIIPAVEGTVGLAGSLAPLRLWQRLGVRIVTLCHNETLPWVDSATDAPSGQHAGLSAFGVEIMREMNRLGLIIDMAHVAPHAMPHVLAASGAPVMITHSCAAALCGHPRNTPDSVLKQLAAQGGLFMVTFVPEFLSQPVWDAVTPLKDAYGKTRADVTREELRIARRVSSDDWPRDGIDVLCDHLAHLRDVIGEDHLGIGSDFYGGPNPPGLADAACFPHLFAELLARGWSEASLAKLAGGNFLRVWREILTRASA
jgi:membrane dipeptidase